MWVLPLSIAYELPWRIDVVVLGLNTRLCLNSLMESTILFRGPMAFTPISYKINIGGFDDLLQKLFYFSYLFNKYLLPTNKFS